MITVALPIVEASQVADARRRATERARSLAMDEVASGRVSIVVSELATNLLKFGREGVLLLDTYADVAGEGIQVLALDKGPGMVDVARCLEDGFSTAGSSGHGLGAIARLTQGFVVESWPSGTAILARVGSGEPRSGTTMPAFGLIEIPFAGETACGDAICVRQHPWGWSVLVADGLGHGSQAAEASVEAIRLYRAVETEPAATIVAHIHGGLRHTRGAAIAVARLDVASATLSYCGLGNIAGRIVTGRDHHQLVSLAGTAGHNARKITSFDYAFPPGSLLVMHSDGLSSSWSLEGMPGLLAAHPTLIAGILYRDHARVRDDASVVVLRGEAA